MLLSWQVSVVLSCFCLLHFYFKNVTCSNHNREGLIKLCGRLLRSGGTTYLNNASVSSSHTVRFTQFTQIPGGIWNAMRQFPSLADLCHVFKSLAKYSKPSRAFTNPVSPKDYKHLTWKWECQIYKYPNPYAEFIQASSCLRPAGWEDLEGRS